MHFQVNFLGTICIKCYPVSGGKRVKKSNFRLQKALPNILSVKNINFSR